MAKDGTDSPLVAASHFAYRRTPTDRPWAVVFLTAWTLAVAGGIYAATHTNPVFSLLDRDYLADPAHCPLHGERRLLEAPGGEPEFDLLDFWSQAATWVVAAVAMAVLLGGLVLHLFKEHAPFMTRATVYSQVAFPIFLAVAFTLTGGALLAIPLLAMGAFAAVMFYIWRAQIELASNLLSVSARGLAANPGLIGATVLLNLVSLLSVSPLLIFGAYAYANGGLVPNPARQGSDTCTDTATGEDVLCCAWQPTGAATGLMVYCGVLLLWTLMFWQQVRVFVVSGTVAQWYFAPPHAPSTRGTTLRSLKHAVGPQMGTLCLGGAVLTATQLIRNAANREAHSQQRGQASILRLLAACLASCLAGIIEFLTKFATVFTAITGDPFFSAGRQVTDLLARNFLDAFASTIWFIPTVINLAAVTLSLAGGLLCGAGYHWMHSGAGELHHTANSVVLGLIAAFFSSFVLSFLGGVLLSVLDATFVCWAIDKDSHTISHPEVYEAFLAVPLPPGAVVQQPGGGMVYGAPQEQGGSYHAPVLERV